MNTAEGQRLELEGQELWLLPEKALYMPATGSLVMADLHLGKSAHFRKAGIMIPQGVGNDRDYERLRWLISDWRPRRILFLGDLFHSELNNDWEFFKVFAQANSAIELLLVEGNHDVLHQGLYLDAGLTTVPMLDEGQFIYSHEPLAKVPDGKVNIAGHIHPGCMVRGLGRQHIKLPCFHHESSLLLLPAFGSLTGCYVLPRNGAVQYAVAEDKLFALH